MSFLSIPFEIRRRIYAYAGLVRSCSIDLLHEGEYNVHRQPYQRCEIDCLIDDLVGPFRRPACHCPGIPVSVLRVCRQVYEEASSVLYSTNDFMLLATTAADLQSIPRIFTASLRHIRSLLIRLNGWPCVRGHDLYQSNWRGTECMACRSPTDDMGLPLSLQQASSRSMLEAWKTICTHLATALVPDQLHLSLIADVAGVDEARQVVDGLRRLPRLKKLDIRLARHQDPTIRQIAYDAARAMTGQYMHAGIFAFETLPEELRMRILEFTELAPCHKVPAPTRRAHTSSSRGRGRGRGGRNFYRRHRYQTQGAAAPSERPKYHDRSHVYRERETSSDYGGHHDEVYIRNIHYSKGRHDGSTSNLCCRNCTLTALSCCCRDLYAASSAYCTCRRIPTELFRVSKTLYKDASKVFYARNAFVFHQKIAVTLEFVTNCAPTLLRMLTNFAVKAVPTGDTSQDVMLTASDQDIGHIIDALREGVPLATLSFTFDTSDYYETGLWSEEWKALYAGHCSTARLMQKLRGIRNLHFLAAKEEWDEPLTRLAQGGEPVKFEDIPASYP
jgi:hypothetical protein